MSALGDRRLATRAGLALVLAGVRYRLTVAPVVRDELASPSGDIRGASEDDTSADARSSEEYPSADIGGASEADGGYMRELSLAAGEAFAGLPAAGAVSRAALASARRAAEAQIRMHAAPRLGTGLGEVRELPGAPAHLVMLTGAVAYYASAPGGRAELARPALSELERTLAPLTSATLTLLRAWRKGRR
jgi:hypothetical protein